MICKTCLINLNKNKFRIGRYECRQCDYQKRKIYKREYRIQNRARENYLRKLNNWGYTPKVKSNKIKKPKIIKTINVIPLHLKDLNLNIMMYFLL